MRVFEHQQISVGDRVDGQLFDTAAFESLARHHYRHKGKYYNLLHKGIQFKNYVGVLQIGNLTIEILPKIDRKAKGDKDIWQGVLLDMLRFCQLLKIETLPAARQQLRRHSILDLYFEIYLKLVAQYLYRGLQSNYRRAVINEKVWKGQPDFHLQLQHNLAHAERCYTRHQRFDFQQPLNQIICQALEVVFRMSNSPLIRQKAQQLLHAFPNLPKLVVTEALLQDLRRKPIAKPISDALDIASLLLLRYSPSLRAGEHALLALLFDMNLLFEEYIYRQFQRAVSGHTYITRQQKRPFWRRSFLRPDLLVRHEGQTYVLDTKWKLLRNQSPDVQDLRQAYVYAQYFGAQKAVLIYPGHGGTRNIVMSPFRSFSDEGVPTIGQVLYASVVKAGRLNKQLGAELLEGMLLCEERAEL